MREISRRCEMVRVFYFCVPLPHVRYCAYRFDQPLDNCDELDAKSQNRNDRLDFFDFSRPSVPMSTFSKPSEPKRAKQPLPALAE